MTLEERIKFAKEENHDIIFVKNGQYISGTWDEREYAEAKGWKLVGTVAQLWNEQNK